MAAFNPFCVSSYLAFRYVVKSQVPWKDGILPDFPVIPENAKVGVKTADEILAVLRPIMETRVTEDTGILLSGGIDSAILAAMMPRGSHAYTIRFVAEGAVDESISAGDYIRATGLTHHVVDVTWEDYLTSTDLLMRHKRSPLHAVEVGLYKAASTAKRHGINRLVVGNGADSTFGGLDKLLSRDWSFDDFVRRYTFVDPYKVLTEPIPMNDAYEFYRRGDSIDVLGFLKTVHGLGVIQAFNNAIHAGGCETLEPFEELFLDAPLNIERIRKGESKYLVREVFKRLYPNLDIKEKIAFARPMDQWLKQWNGPSRQEFRSDIDVSKFSGDQKWLLFCLNRFLNIFESTGG